MPPLVHGPNIYRWWLVVVGEASGGNYTYRIVVAAAIPMYIVHMIQITGTLCMCIKAMYFWCYQFENDELESKQVYLMHIREEKPVTLKPFSNPSCQKYVAKTDITILLPLCTYLKSVLSMYF